MNKVTGFFLEDWRRKVLALGIAILIWSWVEGQISVEEEVQLTLVVAEGEIRTPQDFQLMIQAPAGWVLTSPAAGASIPVRLHGSSSELTDFRGNQCAASIRVAFTADPNQDRYEYPITPEKLDWLRPGDASFLLKGVQGAQQLQSLTFERIEEKVIVLSQREVPVEGVPSPLHEAPTDKMVFEPSQVTVTGPKFAVDRLQAQIDAAYSAESDTQGSGFLRTLRIDPDTRADIRASLTLNPDFERFGIRMEPSSVRVTLPVRLKSPTEITWFPEVDDLIVIPADDARSRGPWTHEAWVPTQWVASMPDIDSELALIDKAWIQEHVYLVLPMQTLTSASLDNDDLFIEAQLFGLTEDEIDFYRTHLTIKPADPESAKVQVSRTQ